MSRTASIDSSFAGPMKLHVFTTSTSAASGSSTSSCPRRARTPSMTSLSTRFLGQPSVSRWTRRGSLTEVGELHRDAEVALANRLQRRLQVVPLLARHPDLVALDRDLDLQLQILHELHDLAALLRRDALLELDGLLRRPRRPRLDVAPLERLQRHLPPSELLAQDFGEGAHLVIVGGEEMDRRVLAAQLRLLALEVEPLRDLAQRLLDRVVDLLQVDAAYDVEGRHFRGPLNRRAA